MSALLRMLEIADELEEIGAVGCAKHLREHVKQSMSFLEIEEVEDFIISENESA